MNDITKLRLPRPNSWYYENGYLTIDLELFGKYLCAVFNKFLGEYYYFQKFRPTIKTDKERPIWQQGEESKYLAIISPNLYDENSKQNYNRVRVVHSPYPRPQYLEAYTTRSREYPSMFSYEPLILDDKDFLLYFGDYSCENLKVNLGHVENGKFVPTDSFKTKPTTEINHTNLQYPFIEDFIKEILYYKIVNIRPNLDQSDMDLILKEFGISRNEKLQTLITLFKSMQEEATERLLESNNVGSVLKLKKDKNVK